MRCDSSATPPAESSVSASLTGELDGSDSTHSTCAHPTTVVMLPVRPPKPPSEDGKVGNAQKTIVEKRAYRTIRVDFSSASRLLPLRAPY